MRISDWSSDVCASDLVRAGDLPGLPGDGVAVRVAAASVRDPVHHPAGAGRRGAGAAADPVAGVGGGVHRPDIDGRAGGEERDHPDRRSEEHTSELQSLMRISYAVFCLKKKTTTSIKSDQTETN